jgi:hypothetical protein
MSRISGSYYNHLGAFDRKLSHMQCAEHHSRGLCWIRCTSAIRRCHKQPLKNMSSLSGLCSKQAPAMHWFHPAEDVLHAFLSENACISVSEDHPARRVIMQDLAVKLRVLQPRIVQTSVKIAEGRHSQMHGIRIFPSKCSRNSVHKVSRATHVGLEKVICAY